MRLKIELKLEGNTITGRVLEQDMESCERSLISTIEFWQPAVDGKSAVEKVKADIRAERGV